MTTNLLNEPLFSLPVPEDHLARIRAFARELAYGLVRGFWSDPFDVFLGENGAEWSGLMTREIMSPPEILTNYVTEKWGTKTPLVYQLNALGYLQITDQLPSQYLCRLTEKSFALLEETPQHRVFISYRNQDSSTFALLLLARMKAVGLDPFLDLDDLRLGEYWDDRLINEIRAAQHFILLIGPNTLHSTYVRKEILQAAADPAKLIIPIYHNGVDESTLPTLIQSAPDAATRHELTAVVSILQARQAKFVREEKTSEYNRIIIEILNHFGLTP